MAAIPIPTNPYGEKGVSIGRDPADTTVVSNMQIRGSVPELPNSTDAVPSGIYVPAQDINGNGT